MSIRVIKMPDIGEGIAEVELVAWHVRKGDTIAEDQPIADVMTDKANVEIPSPVAGTVVALGGEIGQTMAVGSELVRIAVGERADTAPAAASDAAAFAPATSTADPAAAAAPEPMPAAPPALVTEASPAASVAPAAASASTQRLSSPADRPIASPSVRRRAWELEIDLAKVRGTGSGGRIMHADLDAYAAQHPVSARTPARPVEPMPRIPSSPAPAGALAHSSRIEAPAAAAPVSTEGVEAIRVVGLRRQIALKMQESKRRIPHFTYVEEIDVTRLEALRGELNEHYQAARGRLSPLPFVMRAIVLAVHEVPQVNARFDDDAGVLDRYTVVHLGIATDTRHGLLVPVVRDAQKHDLWQSAAEVARLAEIARSGRATREQLTGSTITVTSLGPLGGIVSTPIINHPEVAIVGVNRIVERPAIVGGAVAARKLMNLSSSFDHRVVDGADAARFIQAVRGYLEAPASLLVG